MKSSDDPLTALVDFLVDHFDDHELARFIRSIPQGERLSGELSGGSVSRRKLSDELVTALHSRERLTRELFFSQLVDARPLLASEINALMTGCQQVGISHRPPEAFSPLWFRRQFELTRSNLDLRYRPKLHVDADIQAPLQALVCDPAAAETFNKALARIDRAGRAMRRAVMTAATSPSLSAAGAAVQRVGVAGQGVVLDGLTPVELGPLREALEQAREKLLGVRRDVREQLALLASGPAEPRNDAWRLRRRIGECVAAVEEARAFIEQSLHFAEDRFMVLTGEAGSGKSHALAHLVGSRLDAGAPALLLLGEYFERGDPWAQIVDFLGLTSVGRDDLLHRLERTASDRNQRALLAIDALNESGLETHTMWTGQLAGVVALVRQHPTIAFVVSVRTTFEAAVLPEALRQGQHLVAHRGFAGHELEAVEAIRHSFQLPPPRTPLLAPEYANPLFLILQCEVLQARRAAGDPREPEGFVAWLDARVEVAARRADGRNDWDTHDRTIQRGIERIAGEMTRTSEASLPRGVASRLLRELLPEPRHSHSLLRALLVENLLVEVSLPDKTTVVRFQYERLRDVFVARELVRAYVTRQGSIAGFGQADEMQRVWSEPWSYSGVLAALAILLPEEHGVALHAIAPQPAWSAAIDAFVETLPWQPVSILDDAACILVREVLAVADRRERVVETLLLLAAVPQHPLNGRFLHEWLAPMAMADRDEVWSLLLIPMGDRRESALMRLIAWVERQETLADHDDAVLLPLALALGWTLTTSHRVVRDRATKALVHLFEDRLDSLLRWIEDLQQVNDPYVVERGMAVAYGATLRSETTDGLGALADAMHGRWFADGRPPAHLLARDYARGVVAFAHVRGVLGEACDVNAARPPHASDWPEDLPPREELVMRLGGESSLLVDSLVGGGEFELDEVGWDSLRFPWCSVLIAEDVPPSAEALIAAFVTGLAAPARDAWDAWISVRKEVAQIRGLIRHRLLDIPIEDIDVLSPDEVKVLVSDDEQLHEDSRRLLEGATRALNAALSTDERMRFEGEIRLALDPPDVDWTAFPLELVKHHLLYAVFQLGWTADRFDAEDSDIFQSHFMAREQAPPDRLGLKYERIALHQVLARIADRYRYRRGLHDPEVGDEYRGPWQHTYRDIDPTCLLTRTAAVLHDHKPCWWSPVREDIWGEDLADGTGWMLPAEKLPKLQDLVLVTDADSQQWLVLETHRDWEESLGPGADELGFFRRKVRYWIRAYVIRADERAEVVAWLRTQDLFEQRMPEAGDLTPDLMLRERGWAPAWEYYNTPYHARPGWTVPEGAPRAVLPAWDQYMVEGSSKDAAIREGFTLHMPAVELLELLGLQHDRRDGHFVDAQERLAAFDPSIAEAGPRAALLRVDLLHELRRGGYDIVWTLMGDALYAERPGRAQHARDLSGVLVRDADLFSGHLQVYIPERDKGQRSTLSEDHEIVDFGLAGERGDPPRQK